MIYYWQNLKGDNTVDMSEQSVYKKIIDTFKETDSVQQTALRLGVSRNIKSFEPFLKTPIFNI